MKENGPKRWSEATKLIKGRSGKQIRERWFNTLDPNLKKGNWQAEEEQILIQLVLKFGPKWSKLVMFFSGRTENSIKNRLYCILRKVANDKRKAGEIDRKYLDPEGKELQCSAQELLDFLPDALNNYHGPIRSLPPDVDIDNPRVLVVQSQKRTKTGNYSDVGYSDPRPEMTEYAPVRTLPVRSRMHPPPGVYDPRSDYLPPRPADFPVRDFTHHRSEHLNELSNNLASRGMPVFNNDVPNMFPSTRDKSEPILPPLRTKREFVNRGSMPNPFPPVENPQKEYGSLPRQTPHFSEITGSGQEGQREPLSSNEHKQQEEHIYQFTRGKARLTVQPNPDDKSKFLSEGQEDNVEAKIEKYSSMLKDLNELQQQINMALEKRRRNK